jgi:nitrous oxidase accessory protein NosD
MLNFYVKIKSDILLYTFVGLINKSDIKYNKIENSSYGATIFNSNLTFKNNFIADATTGVRFEAFDENYFPNR